jgi:hypothetical protein
MKRGAPTTSKIKRRPEITPAATKPTSTSDKALTSE